MKRIEHGRITMKIRAKRDREGNQREEEKKITMNIHDVRYRCDSEGDP
jgi:hypothetical protein